ncbi:MAG: hypothetical protein V3S55_10105 [Nitrospiraceae bacterium]
MSMPTNLYNYLLANYENIDTIPGILDRLDSIETFLNIKPLPGGGWALRSALVTDDVEDESDQNDDGLSDVRYGPGEVEIFDQGDHDELFADGGATEQSWDRGDHAELFEMPNI